MTFDDAFTRLLGHEGRYSNHVADKGGATCWGVTEAVARKRGYVGDMQDLPVSLAKLIYKADYWDTIKADSLPEAVRFDVFDGAVNSGNHQSICWLQRAAGVLDDGVVGPVTLKACAALPGYVLAAKYNGQRLQFMTGLNTWEVFGRGWARRIASNLMASA